MEEARRERGLYAGHGRTRVSEAENTRSAIRPGDLDPGLCARCTHGRLLESGRGSRFWQCMRARHDPTFPRYPRLPVRECRGYEPNAG
jgi:hypothetical protein